MGGWDKLREIGFREKITSFGCLLGSGLIYIFHWQAHWLIFHQSEFNSITVLFTSKTFEKRKVSSAKILHVEVIPSGRSVI